MHMTDTETGQRWAIARDGAELHRGLEFLSEDQEWGPLESAMLFSSEADASNGAETLCPPFMPGHPEPVSQAELGGHSGATTSIPGQDEPGSG